MKDICRIPVTATYTVYKGSSEPIMTAAEYADIPGRITHSAACQRLTCRAGSLLLVRKEKAHILKVGVRHGLQFPDRLPGQRLHIPVHIGEGGGPCMLLCKA